MIRLSTFSLNVKVLTHTQVLKKSFKIFLNYCNRLIMSIVCVEHIEHKKSKTENYKAIMNISYCPVFSIYQRSE